MLSFWITFLCLNYIKCSRESQYGTIVKKLKSEPYCGKGGNNGCFNEGICNDGKCSCTTKGITGKQCNLVRFKTVPFKSLILRWWNFIASKLLR